MVTLKSLEIDNLVDFDFIEAPNFQRLVCALNNLYLYSVLDDTGKLTSLGKAITLLPLDPCYSTWIIESLKNDCYKESLIIISLITCG